MEIKCPHCGNRLAVAGPGEIVCACGGRIELVEPPPTVKQPRPVNVEPDSVAHRVGILQVVGLVYAGVIFFFGLASVLVGVLLALIPLYFLPTLVAFVRDHKNSAGIVLLNVFLGWTLLGWVAALVWSCLAENSPQNSINGTRTQNPQ